MSDMDAYRDLFLSESADYLQAITGGLLTLEESPKDIEPVEVIFRGAHSLKGMSAAMGYEMTAELTHRMEGLMDGVRKRTRPVDSELVDLMLEAVDVVRGLIDEESQGGTDYSAAQEIMQRITEMATREIQVEDSNTSGEDVHLYSVVVTLDKECVLKAVRSYMVMKRLSYMGTIVDTVPSVRDLEDERFDQDFTVILETSSPSAEIIRVIEEVTEVEKAQVTAHAVAPTEETEGQADPGSPKALGRRTEIPKLSETQTVRISIGHLDSMVDLVGELIIFRSRLEAIAKSLGSKELAEATEELQRISSELQYEVLDTRMVPVDNIFNRFPRMVRDLARDLGKEVAFRMEGLDIELDRTVLDEIGDPIVHLLRNSIDHGIESPEERRAASKPAKGSISLVAKRERDTVKICVSDDGGGIDAGRVWKKACDLGLVNHEEYDEYTDENILLLTCVPGFSTAKKATKVSGRGVGMDAVKGKIEYLGGSMSVKSALGVGTTVELSLPLTLAIIQALLVIAHDQVFALPISHVDEVMRPDGVRLDTIDGAPVLIGRDGSVIPVSRLDELLGLSSRGGKVEAGEHVVLVHYADGIKRGLVVGGLGGRIEAVVKPLAQVFRSVRGVSGATVLGDGSVALILDPRTMFLHGEGH